MKNVCALGLTLGLTALLTSGLTAQTPTRLVVAGKGAPLVVDALFTFPSLRPLLASSVKPDQGFGLFLSVVDPGFTAKATLDKNAGAETYAAAKGDLYLLKSTVKVPLGASIEALGLKTLYLEIGRAHV